MIDECTLRSVQLAFRVVHLLSTIFFLHSLAPLLRAYERNEHPLSKGGGTGEKNKDKPLAEMW